MTITVALKFDALAIFLAAIAGYIHGGESWWWFALFFVLPDIAIIPYGLFPSASPWPRRIYNTAHTYAFPAVLAVIFHASAPYALLGWVAHIALDRLLGFGLKSSQGFKITHVQLVRESPPTP